VWQESRWFGVGINWFATDALSSASIANWAYVSSAHNLVINTLVTSGLVGICVLVLVLLAAMRSILALDVTSHQIAFFGYLIAFLVASATEAIWIPLPSSELFPVVGLVFAVVIVARHDVQARRLNSRRLPERFDVYSHRARLLRAGARRPTNATMRA
jgi:O-antigen ligase